MLASSQVMVFASHYSDNFNRANDATALGGLWTPRLNTLGISSNKAYNVGANNTTAFATYGTMHSDNQKVVITAGDNSANALTYYIVLGANSSGEMTVAKIIGANSSLIINYTAWGTPGSTRGTSSSNNTTWSAGNTFEFVRSGNVYTVTKNNATLGLTWTDSGNVVPRDASHRLAGLGLLNSVFQVPTIDNWTADDQ